MEQLELTFRAENQVLEATNFTPPMFVASNTKKWIKAHFELGTNWDSWDLGAVKAIWKFNRGEVYSAILDVDGNCEVPHEVLGEKTGEVKVNLVASEIENDEVVERLTTYPLYCINVNKVARVNGDNSVAITPSEYEQFVEDVQQYAQTAASARDDAEDAQSAAESARDEAAQSASQALDYADSAESAKNLAVQAKDYAIEQAIAARQARDDADQARNDAQTAEMSAQESAQSASESATAASSSATQAGSSASTAVQAKDYAIEQAQNAQQARYDAEQARGDAQVAERNAEGYAERAETAATNAEQSASRIEGLIPTPTEDGKILVTNDGEYEISELVELGDDYIIGADNSVTHPSGTIYPNAVIGKDNTLDGSQVQANRFGLNVVVGYNNTLDGRNTYGVVAGHYNEVKGQQVGTIIGSMNKVKVVTDGTAQGYPTVLGSDNEILPPEGEYYNDAVLIGSGLKAGSNAQTIIGLYNEQNESIFAVADGRNNAPHNAFEINKDDEYSAKLNNTEITESKLRELKAVMLPTDTASGSIASFPDGAENIPMSSVKASIEPIQDLHGQSSPYPSGGQLWDEQWVAGIYNSTTGLPESSTSNIRSVNPIPIDAGVEIYVYDSDSGGGSIKVCFYDSNDTYLSNVLARNQKVTTPVNTAFIKFSTTNYGTTYKNNLAINYPSTDTSYHPYSNICPISGTTEVRTVREGKNLWNGADAPTLMPVYGVDGNIYGERQGYILRLPVGTYTFSAERVSSEGAYIYATVLNADGTFVELAYLTADTTGYIRTLSLSKGQYFVVYDAQAFSGATPKFDKFKIQLEVGSSATSYEPYVTPLTITTSLGQTVYGGTVDVVSGKLTVDRAMKTFVGEDGEGWEKSPYNYFNSRVISGAINANSSADTFQSNLYAYGAITNNNATLGGCLIWGYVRVRLADMSLSLDEWKSSLSNTPLQVVYPLATPTVIQLTPQEVTTLLGGNTVWADSGDVEVTYKADIQRYIDKKISAVLNA